MGAERQRREDADLAAGVDPLHVGGGILFGIALFLSQRQRVAERHAVRYHFTQNEVGGSVQNAGLDVVATLFAGDKLIAKSATVTWGSATTFHYDRNGVGYPEGYDATYVREMGGNSKAANYDRDGGVMIDEVDVPDIYGDGSPVQLTLRLECNSWAGKTNVKLHHWCLRPTENNY